MASIWKRIQDPALMCDIKKSFFLLLILTLSFSVIAYVYGFSFKPFFTYSLTLFNNIHQNQSYNVVTTDFPDNKPAPISTKNLLLHRYVAHPSNFYFILDEPDKCKKNPFLVLMVLVAPSQVEARNAIRSTWGNESTVQGKTVLTLFVVGLTGGNVSVQQQLEEERRQHKDIIQSSFVDSYFNLTIKTMVIMDWLATRCPQATFSMKVDSDMYINLKNLMTLLLQPKTPKQNYITGYLMLNVLAIRNKKSKYYVSEELYPKKRYPSYVLGCGYVFSNDLPKKIVKVSKDIEPFNMEDAYIGVCLERLGIKPSRAPDPSQFRTFMNGLEGHNLSQVITTIARSPKQIIEFWQSVKR